MDGGKYVKRTKHRSSRRTVIISGKVKARKRHESVSRYTIRKAHRTLARKVAMSNAITFFPRMPL